MAKLKINTAEIIKARDEAFKKGVADNNKEMKKAFDEAAKKIRNIAFHGGSQKSEPCDFSYSDLLEINKNLSSEVVKMWHERHQNTMFKKSFFYWLYKIFNRGKM